MIIAASEVIFLCTPTFAQRGVWGGLGNRFCSGLAFLFSGLFVWGFFCFDFFLFLFGGALLG